MLITKQINREKFFAHNPMHVGTVANVRFYENPIRGDEAPLIADIGKEIGHSVFYEVPTLDELL
jgi:hypothetical protein